MKLILLTGRLTSDPEVKSVSDKKSKVANFTVANNDKDDETAEFFDVCCWDKLAEFAENYMKKGNKVVIFGTFNDETYKDKEGNNRHHFRITASKIEFAS